MERNGTPNTFPVRIQSVHHDKQSVELENRELNDIQYCPHTKRSLFLSDARNTVEGSVYTSGRKNAHDDCAPDVHRGPRFTDASIRTMRKCRNVKEMVEDIKRLGFFSFDPTDISSEVVQRLIRDVLSGVTIHLGMWDRYKNGATSLPTKTYFRAPGNEYEEEEVTGMFFHKLLECSFGGLVHNDFWTRDGSHTTTWDSQAEGALEMIAGVFTEAAGIPTAEAWGDRPASETFKAKFPTCARRAETFGPGHHMLETRLWTPVLQTKRLFLMAMGVEANPESDIEETKRVVEAHGYISEPGASVVFYNYLCQHAGVAVSQSEHTDPETDKLAKLYRAMKEDDAIEQRQDAKRRRTGYDSDGNAQYSSGPHADLEAEMKKAALEEFGPFQNPIQESFVVMFGEGLQWGRQWFKVARALDKEYEDSVGTNPRREP